MGIIAVLVDNTWSGRLLSYDFSTDPPPHFPKNIRLVVLDPFPLDSQFPRIMLDLGIQESEKGEAKIEIIVNVQVLRRGPR